MKYLNRKSLMCLLVSLGLAGFANAEIGGIWQGELSVAPGNELTVQFVINAKPDGSYGVVLNSPDSGAIKDVAANTVSYVDGMLEVEVADLNGSFKGQLEDGSLRGNWNQLGESLPLVLSPYEEQPLSSELVAMLSGRWQGSLEVPGQTLTIVTNFGVDGDGKLSGTMSSPDQGPQRFPIQNIEASESSISFNVNAIRGSYKGTIADGEMTGEWTQGQSLPLNLSKGELDPRQYALDLSPEAKQLLLGSWHGDMDTPVGPVTAVFRFVEVETDFIRGYLDSPDRGAYDIPLKEVDVKGDEVSISVGNGSSFSGKFTDGNITGDYRQQGQQLPVTLEQGDLPPLPLDLAASAHEQLAGSWQGQLTTPQGRFTIRFRFEDDGQGKLVGFIDSPDQGLTGARIRAASLEGDQLSVRSDLLRLQYTATLSGGNLQGQMAQGGQSLELNLKRL